MIDGSVGTFGTQSGVAKWSQTAIMDLFKCNWPEAQPQRQAIGQVSQGHYSKKMKGMAS